MAIMKHPHDALIKKSFENPYVAREFFEEHVRQDVQKVLDFNSLKLEKESFIEKNLKNSLSDVLFSVKFKDETGYIYLLLENQSKPDRFMALRLFKYMINIIDRHRTLYPKTKKLPLIYPMIFYNGGQKYTVPRNIWDLFTKPTLARELWINDYQLINVHDIPDTELKKRIWAGTMQFFAKHAWERDILKRWEELSDILPKLAKLEIGQDFIRILLTYSLTKIKEDDRIEVKKFLHNKLRNTGEKTMVSIAQAMEREIKAKLVQEMAKEKANLVQEMEKKIKTKAQEEEKLSIATNMLKYHTDIDFIVQITKLSREKVISLQSSL